MKTPTFIVRAVTLLLAALLLMPATLFAQTEGDADQADRFSKEELTQMLAPIALYPDSLVAQVLMASTYPLELVEAERWLRQNPELKDEALDNALKDKEWDPSVKSLCRFPDLLFSMSDKLDQTRKLGDAFLAQEDDVMNTIQDLRQRAKEQGSLKTTSEQKVVVEEDEILIEPADPKVVYVPVYDPYYVYGPWWYPGYLPYYWYYPPGFVGGAYITFGPRIYFGFDLFPWVWFDWRVHRVYIDYNRTRHFHRPPPSYRTYDRPVWRHDPRHRRGVAYRDRRTSEVYGTRHRTAPATRPEVRGYPSGSSSTRPSATTSPRRERTGTPPTRTPSTMAPSGSTDRTRDRDRDRSGTVSTPTVITPSTTPQAPQSSRDRNRDRERSSTGSTPSSPPTVITPSSTPAPQSTRSSTRTRERSTIQQQQTVQPRVQTPSRRETPFRGVGEGNLERRAVERGGASLRSREVQQERQAPSRGDQQPQQRGSERSGGGGRGTWR